MEQPPKRGKPLNSLQKAMIKILAEGAVRQHLKEEEEISMAKRTTLKGHA